MSNAAAPPASSEPAQPDFTETTSCPGQSKNWIFTRQATPAESAAWNSSAASTIPEPYRWHEDPRVTFVAYQIERAPRTGQLHVQGMISFKSSCRYTAVKTIIGNKPHVERLAKPDAHFKYVTKEDSRVFGPWVHGDRPKGQGKSKEKMGETIWKASGSGKPVAELIEEDPQLIMHKNALEWAMALRLKAKSNRQKLKFLRVIVSYGETGTGKTFSAINFVAGGTSYYKLSAPSLKGGALWFQYYAGEDVLIMDDWDGQCCTAAVLKNLLDKYELMIPTKGGMTYACWHTVVITSNLHPRDWYIRLNENSDTTEVRPLKRRVTEIRHYLDERLYQVENWEGEAQGDQIEEPELDLSMPEIPEELLLDTPPDRIPTPEPDPDHMTDIAEPTTPRVNRT